MVVDVPQLASMSPDELDALFSESAPGEIPVGRTQGAVLVAPGTEIAWPAKRLIQWLVWRGKVFNPQKQDLLNVVGPLDLKSFRAKVYKEPSWFDGKETIVLDYSDTSLVAQWVRDEIREVAPHLYLGLVFWERDKILHFSLQFDE